MSKMNIITEDGHIQFKKPEENVYAKTEWLVMFKHGYGDHPIIVNGDTVTDAKNMALAEFRKKTGHINTVDPWHVDDVIESVERYYKS